MGLALLPHGVDSHPPEVSREQLGILVTLQRFYSSLQGVAVHIVRQPIITQVSVVRRLPIMHASAGMSPHCILTSPPNRLLGAVKGNAPSLSQGGRIDWLLASIFNIRLGHICGGICLTIYVALEDYRKVIIGRKRFNV